ncbi:MAG TPA: rhomboid family intramembrane serine protease [Tepidisphaeraceae bacterium]|nr:rhomboid family intramembrane serine protease [Tepidisphaeraceae bacterium]
MLIPIRTDSPLRRTPWMNVALIALNVLLFVVQKNSPAFEDLFELKPRDPAVFNYLTYAFLHDTGGSVPMHLIGNMLFLWIFGNNVNDKLGHLGYLGFYLAGAVFSGVGFVATNAVLPVQGASGAISAVTGAYLVLFPRSHVTLFYYFFLIGTLDIPSVWFILLYFGKDLIGFSGISGSGGMGGVAYAAHVSGTVFGFAVCFVMLVTNLLPRDHFDVLSVVNRWNRRRVYRDAVAGGYDPFNRHGVGTDAHPPAPADPRQVRALDFRSEALAAVARHDVPRAAELYVQMKAFDPAQVLTRQAQLDVANQLASQQKFAEAAEAYEQFLRSYPNFEQIEQVELMLGLIYARYLDRFEPARKLLVHALSRLHGDREIALARQELARIEPLVPRVQPQPG